MKKHVVNAWRDLLNKHRAYSAMASSGIENIQSMATPEIVFLTTTTAQNVNNLDAGESYSLKLI